jgi:hypothetical protein
MHANKRESKIGDLAAEGGGANENRRRAEEKRGLVC